MSEFTGHQNNDGDAERLLAHRLRETRKYVGFTQEEVANYLKIPRSSLADIENGQRQVEAIELTRLARLYRQREGYFTGEDAATRLPIDLADLGVLARKAEHLSEQDLSEIVRFAEYLRAR